MILRYTKHVQSICGRNFDEHIISIQALVSIWHAALHEARSQDEQKTLEGTRWKSVWEVNQPCVTWGQCFKGNNLSRIVKACKSHDFCFKNPLTNGPGWPGHSYDQLTSLLDPPSSESRISAHWHRIPGGLRWCLQRSGPRPSLGLHAVGHPIWKRDRCGARGGWRVAWWFQWRLGILDDNCVDELTIENPVGFSNSHKFTTFSPRMLLSSRDFHQHCTQFIQFESLVQRSQKQSRNQLEKEVCSKTWFGHLWTLQTVGSKKVVPQADPA